MFDPARVEGARSTNDAMYLGNRDIFFSLCTATELYFLTSVSNPCPNGRKSYFKSYFTCVLFTINRQHWESITLYVTLMSDECIEWQVNYGYQKFHEILIKIQIKQQKA